MRITRLHLERTNQVCNCHEIVDVKTTVNRVEVALRGVRADTRWMNDSAHRIGEPICALPSTHVLTGQKYREQGAVRAVGVVGFALDNFNGIVSQLHA
jgi:hypothetical protein